MKWCGQRVDGSTTDRAPAVATGIALARVRPPGYYTSALGVLLPIAGSIAAAIHEREEVRSTTMLCAPVGWGFDGVLWTLKGLATQVRDGQRRGFVCRDVAIKASGFAAFHSSPRVTAHLASIRS